MNEPTVITVNDSFQSDYRYTRTVAFGQDFDANFAPELTPKQLLTMGVFDGKYMNDCHDEFPSDWFSSARVSPKSADVECNFFGVHASQPLSVWREKGWIHDDDPRGWFQWYCRYYSGRRLPDEDQRQIKRWKAMRRHVGQLKKYCLPGDWECRTRQRQALLHWAYDSRKL